MKQLTVDYGEGFSTGQANLQTLNAAVFSGSTLSLSPVGATHVVGGAWYKTQQDISSFQTEFTFQLPGAVKGSEIAMLTFVVQNSNSTTNPLAFGVHASADANVGNYGAFESLGGNQQPIANSVAILFDMGSSGQNCYPITAGGSYSTTGLAVNGGTDGFQGFLPAHDLNPSGIDLHSGNIFDCKLVYDGTLLTMVLKDTVTGAQFRQSFPINIPACTGGNMAWVGFGAGNVSTQKMNVLTWQFSQGFDPRLATPTFSVSSGSYATAQSVAISGTAGAAIYYTVNGLQPTSSSTPYTGPVKVAANEYLQAVAIKAGCTDSLVSSAAYRIGNTNSVNLGTGFSVGDGMILCGNAVRKGSQIQLTDVLNNLEVGTAWWGCPVKIKAGFSTAFSFQFSSSSGFGNGLCFVLQNQNAHASDGYNQTYGTGQLHVTGGPTIMGNFQTGMGYGASRKGVGFAGIYSSMAIAFDLFTAVNSVGLYTGGALPNGAQVPITGVSLTSGHPIDVALTYDGTTLSITLKDTATAATFSHSWVIDIAGAIGQDTAYAGFTAGTEGQGQWANMLVSRFSFKEVIMATVFPPLVKGFSFTIATTDTAGNPLPTGEAESAATIGIRLDGDTTHGAGNYQFIVPVPAGVSAVTPDMIAAALGKPLAPGNYWAAVDQTDSLNGSLATSAFTAEVPFSIPQPVVQPASPTGFTVA